MKKLAYLTLALGLLLSAFSCSKDGVIYDPKGNPCLSFPVNAMTVPASEDGVFTVELWRGNTNGALSVPVNIYTEYSDIITPSAQTFEFQNGQNIATITFQYNPDALEFNTEYNVDIDVMDLETISPTGNEAITLTLIKALTFTEVGTANFTYSDYWGDPLDATLSKANEVDGYYTFLNCYEDGYDLTFTFDGVNVTVPTQNIGYYGDGYGPFCMKDPVATLNGDELTIEYELTLPEYGGYSFGTGFIEVIQLPAGWNN